METPDIIQSFLADMVESIRKNGVLSPSIVQPDGDGYEILSGHNR